MLSFNNSLNKLQLWIQEPQGLLESIPTQEKFSSNLHWLSNRSFYYMLNVDHVGGSRMSDAQAEYKKESEKIEDEKATLHKSLLSEGENPLTNHFELMFTTLS